MEWKQERPPWCKHKDCKPYRRVMDSACGGLLPEPIEHDGDYNTFRICIRTATDTIDYQMNETDLNWLRWIFDALDGKQSSWLSKGCPHKLQSKLIEIPGKDKKMWGTPQYEPDYSKLEAIAHKIETGEGVNYCYLEFVYCNDCDKILELNQIFTDGERQGECPLCDRTGVFTNIWDNTEDCPRCKGK